MADARRHMSAQQRNQPSGRAVSQTAPNPFDRGSIPRLIDLLAYEMIRSSRIAAILVDQFAPPDSDTVLRYVEWRYQCMVGWINPDEIDLNRNETRQWIDAQHARLGRPAGSAVRPGYYLFAGGEVCAYHPGLIDFKSDKASLGVGALAAVAGLFWQRTSLLGHAVWVARFQASLRVLDYFEAALTELQQHAANQAPPQAQTPTLEQVNLAFELLGLAPFATQSEVKARFRALAKEWHPDLFTNDASKSAEASLRMSQINVAYSVICEARGW